jgi:regulator of protease activity HflC (stomatin/prohibitin superfamily)
MEQGKPFYQQRWFKIATPVVGVVAIYALMHWNQPAETLAGWLVDTLAVLMMFFGTLALASQYVLPVRTIRERQKALDRLLSYVSGMHGPIAFVRDGQPVGSVEELKRRGAGAILVDGSSAVVLERGRQFSRAAGPGMVFTEFNERLAAAFDLRKQSRSQDTQALTKDGIEIKTSVSVTFALDPGDQVSLRESLEEHDMLGQARITPAFPFNPDSAFKAYYGFAVTEKDMLKWMDLPIVVASEYFRDHVSRLTLDDLFMPRDPQSSPVAALQTRLTDQVQKAPLLKERGIKAYSVSIGLLELPEEVTRQRTRTWAARWQKEAFTTLATADVEAERIKEKARAEAQSEMLSHFREYLSQTFSGDGEATKQEIAQKFVTALNRVASDPVTQMLISGDTMKQLTNLRYWVGLPAEATDSVQMIGQPASEDLSEIVAEDSPGDEDGSPAKDIEPGGTAEDVREESAGGAA